RKRDHAPSGNTTHGIGVTSLRRTKLRGDCRCSRSFSSGREESALSRTDGIARAFKGLPWAIKPKEGGTLAGARPLSTPHSEIYSSRSFTSLLNWTWAASSTAGGDPGLA